MLTTIQDEVRTLLPAKRKVNSASGWISFNAPCCVHNGESADARGRGGIMANTDGSVSYHCFNCHFKANYTPGRHLNYKFKKLLGWLGASENTVKRLIIEAIRIKDFVTPETLKTVSEDVKFTPRELPPESVSFQQWRTILQMAEDGSNNFKIPESLMKSVDYIGRRSGNLIQNYEFYVTDDSEHNMHKRVIIPCYWKGELIGSTARAWEDGIKPKYYADYEPNYVFNMDRQLSDSKFVIVCEGPFDAMAVDGIAVLSNECSEIQADIIDSLGKEVIVVPDFDIKVVNGKKVWSGKTLIDQAIEYGWAVSFPVWSENVKDTSEAVGHYGKLFTLKSILEGKETSRLKIELKKKKLYN